MNPWDHLPNARYINRILGHFPKNYSLYVRDSISAVEEELWSETRYLLKGRMDGLYEAAIDGLYEIPGTTSDNRIAASTAIMCLIVYKDCGYLFESAPDELAILSALGEARAMFLYPAVRALHKSSDTVST